MPDYEEIIKQSQANVKSLSEKLKDLDTLYQEIKALKAAAEGVPEIFNKKFGELVKLSEDYTNALGATTKNYLDGNNTLFTTKLSELSTKIKEFEKEITRLVNTDFTKLFKELQKDFIDQTRDDLAKELIRFEEKIKELQTKIDQLKIQIERLEKIDLEEHFDKLQKTLAEIFGAINTINLSLTNIIQTVTGIVQSVGTIQTTLDTNHKESNQLLNSFNEATKKQLADQDKQAKKNVELLESKMKSLSEQSELLEKELKTNRIIQIIGLTIILFIIIYVAVKR
jgi:predicted  nucleic acid-binding Zn-ribbon protein